MLQKPRRQNGDGNIKGIVKNNTEQVVENKYLKISVLSKNNRMLTEKYVRIDKLEVGELKKFDVSFECDNFKTFKIEYTDTMPEGISFIELIKENVKDIGKDVLGKNETEK